MKIQLCSPFEACSTGRLVYTSSKRGIFFPQCCRNIKWGALVRKGDVTVQPLQSSKCQFSFPVGLDPNKGDSLRGGKGILPAQGPAMSNLSSLSASAAETEGLGFRPVPAHLASPTLFSYITQFLSVTIKDTQYFFVNQQRLVITKSQLALRCFKEITKLKKQSYWRSRCRQIYSFL